MLLQILTYTHHLTTMLFGIFLSAFFLGVKQNKKNVCILLSGAAVSGLFFLICNTVFGSLFTEAVYPIFVHLPLFLLLVFYYRFRWLPSIISIMTAYLCCQFSNCRYFCLIPERIGLGLLPCKDYRDCCRFRFLKPVSVPDYRTAFCKI